MASYRLCLWHTKKKLMIQLVIIRKIFLSIVPLVLFYILRKMVKNQEPKKRSRLPDFDKEKIVEGEIVDESSRNR